jgi:hypothetical protein
MEDHQLSPAADVVQQPFLIGKYHLPVEFAREYQTILGCEVVGEQHSRDVVPNRVEYRGIAFNLMREDFLHIGMDCRFFQHQVHQELFKTAEIPSTFEQSRSDLIAE